MKSLRVLIAGGGTGGHLYPGIAVARELLARMPEANVTFAGTSRGIESRVVPREGFELDLLRSAGLKGASVPALLRGVALLPLSGIDAWRIVSRRSPDVVVGVGGYSSGPIVLVAAVRGIPTLLLEQNAVPGLTNRLLARLVSAAAVTFEPTVAYFGRRGFVAGNPVRPEFFPRKTAVPRRKDADTTPRENTAPSPRKTTGAHGAETAEHEPGAAVAGPPRILIFGGSQGAHAINVAMVEAAPRLAAHPGGVAVTHQTGERDLERVRDGYRHAGLEARVEPFLYAMDREMNSADLVVSRAGATTIAELAAAGRPAVLVPLPTAADDHQRRNAEVLAAAGAAEVIDQRDLSGERLAARIAALVGDRARLAAMSAAMQRLAKPAAAQTIVDRIVELARPASRLPEDGSSEC